MDNAIAPIRHVVDALRVRNIRNSCREFMTNSTASISIPQQIYWYFTSYKRAHKLRELTCYLFTSEDEYVGYGLIRKNGEKYWISGGLIPTMRGKGLGKILFQKLLDEVKSSDIWLEVLDTNVNAQKIYNYLGFLKVGEEMRGRRRIFILKLKKPR